MKKSKLSISLISCLLSVGTLAGCDNIKSSNDGVLLRYTVDGKEQVIKADEILKDYYNDSTKYQAIYDTIYSVIARNYFTKERKSPTDPNFADVKLGYPQMEKINRDAREKVSDDKDTAQQNADTNNTKYKKELEAIFESKGVEDEDELFDKYVEELQKETFENNFYTYFIEDIKDGDHSDNAELNAFWTGYFKDQVPFHVSHILVKLADESDTNYSDGTISEANALRIYNVINDLGVGAKSFAKIATFYNEDPGSKDKEGDLGIMDYNTSFINEFKLGIYAYEQLYSANKDSDDLIHSNIYMVDDFGTAYKNAVKDMFDIGDNVLPTVDLSVIDELKAVADKEADGAGKPVIENSTLVYPRNVIYNKYLNRHAVFFIENKALLASDPDSPDEAYTKYVINGNYRKFGNKFILTADGDLSKPIIAVRASSGGEQEIHLMVVNRSPFATGENLVTLSNYYTTYYPAQDYYPKDSSGNKLDTYVNFLTNDVSDTKGRAEEFASKLKSYNSDKLGKYIFKKYLSEENVKFEDEKLEKALMKWIDTSIEKANEEKDETWSKTWNEYLDKLSRQNSERSKLVPQACKLVYKKANSSKNVTAEIAADANFNLTDAQIAEIKAEIKASGCADADGSGDTTDEEVNTYYSLAISKWFKEEGGLCNDGKAHL